MKLEAIPARSRVFLLRDLPTMGGMRPAGGIYKVLGFHGSLVRLSREGDRAKLTTLPDFLFLAPKGSAAASMHATQVAYAVARAAAETAREAAEAEIKGNPALMHAAPPDGERRPAETDEVWEGIETSREMVREKHGVYVLHDAMRAAEKAMCEWGVDTAKRLAPEKCPELARILGEIPDLVERAWARPSLWTKLVDILSMPAQEAA